MRRKNHHTVGFTLVEVLVALLVVSIGLLGQMGLQMTSLANNQNAYLRSQAAFLAYDIADRMRLNREAVNNNRYSNFNTGSGNTNAIDCSTGCDADELAQRDLFEWQRNIDNLLPNGSGTIQRDTSISEQAVFVVTIQWAAKDGRLPETAAADLNTLTIDFGV